jgi:dTMP kinase
MNKRFITLEGIDGAGKSTHWKWLEGWLKQQGLAVVATREPGGTPLGERLRELVLSCPMHAETEALLMFAARREHLEKVILPALQAGLWVLCDRFSDATYAYQGGGRAVARSKLQSLEAWVHPQLQPGLTLLFDAPVEVAARRRSVSSSRDRFEQEQLDFFSRVRSTYLQRAIEFPDRYRVLDSTRCLTETRVELKEVITRYCL